MTKVLYETLGEAIRENDYDLYDEVRGYVRAHHAVGVRIVFVLDLIKDILDEDETAFDELTEAISELKRHDGS
jgi:hypothetical protein